MLLEVKDRFVLLGVLPQQGNFLDIRIIADLRKELSFSEKEHSDFGFKTNGEGAGQTVSWNEKKAKAKEVSIGARATILIENGLKKLNDENKLTIDHIDLYARFIEKPEPPKEKK